MPQLADPLRTAKAFQLHFAAGLDGRAAAQSSPRDVGSGTRQQDLSSVGLAHEPRGSNDGGPEVVAIALDRIAGVESHPDPNRCGRRKRLGGEHCLDLDRGLDGTGGPRERRGELVTSGREYIPATGVDHPLEDGIVPCRGRLHFIVMLVPQRRGPFDVAEEERDGSGRLVDLGHARPWHTRPRSSPAGSVTLPAGGLSPCGARKVARGC